MDTETAILLVTTSVIISGYVMRQRWRKNVAMNRLSLDHKGFIKAVSRMLDAGEHAEHLHLSPKTKGEKRSSVKL